MNYDENKVPFKIKYRIYIYPVVIALIVTMFWRPMVADGNSMEPMINDGQVLIIVKEKFTHNRGLPKLYSIVNFYRDFYPTEKKGEHSLARVVGLPGDTIEIKEGEVYRNSKLTKEAYAKGETKGELKVKLLEDEVFVLCDNRENSIDSRNSKVGPVKLEDLRGYIGLRVWPINEFGKLK